MQYILKRWRDVRATALSVATLVLVATAVAITISSGAAANGIMLQIKDLPLKDVVSMLMQQSGANVVLHDQAVLDNKRVTVSLNNVPLEQALDDIVRSAGVSYQKTSDGTYIVGGVDEAPVLSQSDVASALPPVQIQPTPAPPKEMITTKIQLVHSRPSEILRVIGWDGVNPIKNCEPQYPAWTGADEKSGPNIRKSVGGVYLNTKNGDVLDPSKVQFQNGQPVVPTIDPTQLGSGAGRTADVTTGAGQQYYPRGPGNSYSTYQTQPNRPPNPNQPGGGSSTTSTQSSNFLWPEGVEDARPFDLDNSIIVKGDEDGIEKFKKIIRMLDVPPKQVQVKAEFVEISTTDVKSFGIDWSLQRLNESFATAFNPTGNVVVGFATGNLTAALRAQLTSTIGTVINSPIISTINNQNAAISITRTIPYWTSYAVVAGDNNIINQATPNYIEIATELNILPRVNGDGTITMMLQPQVADTGAQVQGPDGTTIPEQRTQELFTQRRVANGETIVVGGFIRKNDSISLQKVPILGDLPIVGGLFRTTNKTTDDRELLIFITPTIIPQTGGGTVGDVPVL